MRVSEIHVYQKDLPVVDGPYTMSTMTLDSLDAAIAEMAPALIGQSCLSPLLFLRFMDERLSGHNYAKAALEMAQMDLMAKCYGIRVCDLLGGAATEWVPAYYATGIVSPDYIAQLSKDKAEQGYKLI